MTEPETIHILTVICGTIAIIILGGAFIIIRDIKKVMKCEN